LEKTFFISFESQVFDELLTQYGTRNVRPGFYAPQANAAERVSRSVLLMLRATTDKDERHWDRIACTLKSGYHETLGLEPYYAMFGTRMVTHASAYAMLRSLGGIEAADRALCLAD